MENVHNVVDLYANPTEEPAVHCVDKKSQVQALTRSQPSISVMPCMPEKYTDDYVRHGTRSLFAALNTADSAVMSSIHHRHRTIEFTKFLAKINTEVADK